VVPVPLSNCTLPRTDFTKPAWRSALAGAAALRDSAEALPRAQGVGSGRHRERERARAGRLGLANVAEPQWRGRTTAIRRFFIVWIWFFAKECFAIAKNVKAKALHMVTRPIIQVVLAAFYRFWRGHLPDFQ
jgi:hypothetical protein